MSKSYLILLFSTVSIGALHPLAPDHWLPFVAIAQARKWRVRRLAFITLVSGLGHVGSSVVLGLLGLALGIGLARVQGIESKRAEVAGLLMIGFGLAYAVWGLKRRHRHHHPWEPSVTTWTLIAVFVLGPCEPLIPLMFLATAYGWSQIFLLCAAFGVITVAMMLTETWLAFRGAHLIGTHRLGHYEHALAGSMIAVVGAAVVFLGI